MPRKCCVPGCHSNYNYLKDGYVAMFRFPRNIILQEKWLEIISRDNWKPNKDSVVCIKHFSESSLCTTEEYIQKNGNKFIYTLPKPKLCPGAFPTIFTNFIIKDKKQKNPQQQEQSFNKADLIENFDHLKSGIDKKIKGSDWHLMKTDCVHIFKLDVDNLGKVSCLLKIDANLLAEVYINNDKITSNDDNWVLPKDGYIRKWSELRTCLQRLPQEGKCPKKIANPSKKKILPKKREFCKTKVNHPPLEFVEVEEEGANTIEDPMDPEDEFYHFCKSLEIQLKNMPRERALICQENLKSVMTKERYYHERVIFNNEEQLQTDGFNITVKEEHLDYDFI